MERTIRETVDRSLLQIVDGSLAGVIFVAPLLMGGRHALGHLVLTALAVTAAAAWAVRQSLHKNAGWRPTWAMPLLLAGLMLVAWQLIPLPPWLLARLSPQMGEILPAWGQGAATTALLGHWTCLSLTPGETLGGLVIFADFILLFFVVVQRTERIEDVERLLRWYALAAVGMALFGIVQLLAGNGKYFWFYEHPYASTSDVVKGSFSNRNHFAQFLALGIGPLIWWLQDALRLVQPRTHTPSRRPAAMVGNAELKTYFLGLALGIVLFAGLLSLSRGGIVAMVLAAAICTGVCYRAALVGRRFVATLAAAGLLIGASLAVFGYDRVSHRLEDFSSGSLDKLDYLSGRRTVWTGAVKALPDWPALGSGVGSFRDVIPKYIDASLGESEFTHAENGPLQIAVETGLAGLGLTLAGVVMCGVWCIGGMRSSCTTRARVCAAAIAGSLAASAAHSMVDFVWYVPACTAMVAMLAGCALRVRQLAKTEGGRRRAEGGRRRAGCGNALSSDAQHLSSFGHRHRHSSPGTYHSSSGLGESCTSPASHLPWPAIAAALILAGGWMIVYCTGPAVAQLYWDEYLIARRAAQGPAANGQNAASEDEQTQRQRIACLENVIGWQPGHVGAQLAMAEAHRRLFDDMQATGENPMSLADIRDAATTSQFASRAALVEWLSCAVGKHCEHLDRALYHTRKALSLSPMQGRGYLYLAELSFLVGADAGVVRACIEQALQVRPFDGDVLFASASESLRRGDSEQWVQYSKRAFRRGYRQREQIIGGLVAGTSAEGLSAMIEFVFNELQPDLRSVRFLYSECVKRSPPGKLVLLRTYWAEKAEAEASSLPPEKAAQIWLEAEQLYSGLDMTAEALKCGKRALECDPGDFGIHYHLALCLMKCEEFAEAETHLRWCLQRMPDNASVEISLREALKRRLESQHRTATYGDRGMSR